MDKGARIEIRVSPDEKQSFEDVATLEGTTLANWMRSRLRAACLKEMKQYGKKPKFVKD